MVTVDIINPEDLLNTFTQIEIQSCTTGLAADMANVITNLAIAVPSDPDESSGFTSYNDQLGTEGTTYYRFRYKNPTTNLYSNWSDIFLSGTTYYHVLFRRRMKDTSTTNPFFSDSDISDYARRAVKKLWPYAWEEVIDESLLTLANTTKYSAPAGVVRISDIEYLDSSGRVVGAPRNWTYRGRKIIFNNYMQAGYTMRLYLEKRYTELAEIPEEYEDLVLDLMRIEAYEDMEADRSKYYKYTTVVSPDGGNMPSLHGIVNDLRTVTKDRLQQLKRGRRAVSYSYV